jgi:hypothetical protein
VIAALFGGGYIMTTWADSEDLRTAATFKPPILGLQRTIRTG